MKRFQIGASVGALLLILTVGLFAQQDPTQRPRSTDEGQQVTLTGRAVNLHEYMTQGASREEPERRPGGAREADQPTRPEPGQKKGDIMALVSARGLVILGNYQEHAPKMGEPSRPGQPAGMHGNPEKGEECQVEGKLYQRDGIKYLDVTSVTKGGEREGQEDKPRRPAPDDE